MIMTLMVTTTRGLKASGVHNQKTEARLVQILNQAPHYALPEPITIGIFNESSSDTVLIKLLNVFIVQESTYDDSRMNGDIFIRWKYIY